MTTVEGRKIWRFFFIGGTVPYSVKMWSEAQQRRSHTTCSLNPYISPFVQSYLKNSLIIQEENTKKNHKRVVSLYVIKIKLISINFSFAFLGLDKVYFKNYFANELI
jgi:hypothetical protein